jgi:RNA polymerase sigma factor (TIGR02999 family)
LSKDGISSVTRLLKRVEEGDSGASDQLFMLVYDELHRMADRQMRRQRPDHTLQATALVNEAYIRVFGQDWRDRDHFLSVAARAMRSILVDHARKKTTAKRTPGGQRVPLDELTQTYEDRAIDLVAMDEALNRLAEVDPNMVRLVELRFFAGLSMEESASFLNISTRKAQKEWSTARAWLRREVT